MPNNDYQKKIEELYTEFPLCFPKPPICGFTIGEGWFPIVRDLCSKIEKILETLPSSEFSVDQVKEKFGGLRFYWGGSSPREVLDQIEVLIREAERQCDKTCESCGAPGTLKTNGWMRTICEDCEKERNRNRALEFRKSTIFQKARNLFGKTWKEWEDLGEESQNTFLQDAEKQLLESGEIKPLDQY